jgi:hypothetical protein
MSYTYLNDNPCENSTSFAERVGVSSVASFADIPASVLSRLNLTHERYCCNGSETESCHASPSGTMCEHSTESLGEEKLTSFAADFPARIFHAPERAQASKAQEAECGWKWRESSVKFDPASRSWKTRQCSLLGGLESFSETWPRWGMMRDGECWELATYLGLTSDLEFGSNAFFTPTSRDYKGMSGSGLRARHGAKHNLADCIGGVPNPMFSEWLMGWPLGWTDLKPLGMGKFQQWLDSHGKL